MNELIITYSPTNWIYYKTEQVNVDDAYTEFICDCENIGINIDNMNPLSVILRDENGNEINRIRV